MNAEKKHQVCIQGQEKSIKYEECDIKHSAHTTDSQNSLNLTEFGL